MRISSPNYGRATLNSEPKPTHILFLARALKFKNIWKVSLNFNVLIKRSLYLLAIKELSKRALEGRELHRHKHIQPTYIHLKFLTAIYLYIIWQQQNDTKSSTMLIAIV